MSKRRFSEAVLLGILLVLGLAADASAQDEGDKRYFRGFYVGAMYSSLSNPTFRLPSGTGEVPVPQSASAPSFMLGYDFGGGGFGIGGRLLYFNTGLKPFAVTEMPGTQTFASYADPKFTHISFDLLVHWLPFKGVTLGFYGLLGMASSTEQYQISGATFTEWNGSKSLSEFDYSYGLGVRYSPLRLVSLFAEIRIIPGDLTTEYSDYLYSDDMYNYYGSSRSFTKNASTLLSFGLSANF